MSAYSRGDVETVRSLSTRDAFWIASYLEYIIKWYDSRNLVTHFDSIMEDFEKSVTNYIQFTIGDCGYNELRRFIGKPNFIQVTNR